RVCLPRASVVCVTRRSASKVLVVVSVTSVRGPSTWQRHQETPMPLPKGQTGCQTHLLSGLQVRLKYTFKLI
ncbi:hypothetical protein, partial [Azoarcus indigens]|uniref:hypothetical protein n=1 Tax=Azoarcus indigens TaxID=29545 RepID=UPI001B87EF61